MSVSHQASPDAGRTWGPIDVPVYCDACGAGTEHRWADFAAERIECQACHRSRLVEHVEGDPAL